MLEQAKAIVAEFEENNNITIVTNIEEWNSISDEIMLYLSAKKYIERYG